MDQSKLRKPLHLETPLMRSPALSEKTGMNIWLKLENVQNTGSYKIRGIGNFCQEAVKRGCTHLVSSSGGNAGIAAAYAAKELGVPCTVVVPEMTAPFMRKKIEHIATNVVVQGASWAEANVVAKELCNKEGFELVHPFDHPDVWEGHSTMIDEIAKQLHGKQPDALVLSVGGGGLFCGIMKGMTRNKWGQVPIIALETEGARSFNLCVESGEWGSLTEINTIAKTLGIKQICNQAFDWIKEYKPIFSEVVTDKEAVKAALDFADDHRFLVSPSAGAALVAVYSNLLQGLQKAGSLPAGPLDVVVVVCGGNEVDLKEITHWKQLFDL